VNELGRATLIVLERRATACAVPIPSDEVVARVSAAIAMAACALLYLEARAVRRPSRLLVHTIAGLLAAAAVTTYFQFFTIPAGQYFHRWEMFHYFMGAKYAPELSYDRLYVCTVVAEAELGHRSEVEARSIRDLRNDALISGREALRDPAACKRHFEPQRWQSFRADIARFRKLAGTARYWAEMQADHGYNPSPVWTIAGRALASLAPPSRSTLSRLALIDPLLMALTIAALGWGFGARSALLATIFWGTQAPATFSWTGGAFLRQDWLLACVLAAALLRKQRPMLAGFFLACSGMLRVFPCLLWAGPLVFAARELIRERRLRQASARMLCGGALACALLLPAGAIASGGTRQYSAFVEHLAMHAATPISNHLSLRMLLSFAPSARFVTMVGADAADGDARWTDARRAQLERVAPLRVVLSVGLLLWFGWVVWGLRTRFIALALSSVLVFVLTDPSCYYHSLWILALPLCRARPVLESVVLALAAASQLIVLRLPMLDDRFSALSLLYGVFVCVLLAVFTRFRSRLVTPARIPATSPA
jgi:hypothetical protein